MLHAGVDVRVECIISGRSKLCVGNPPRCEITWVAKQGAWSCGRSIVRSNLNRTAVAKNVGIRTFGVPGGAWVRQEQFQYLAANTATAALGRGAGLLSELQAQLVGDPLLGGLPVCTDR